MTKALFDRTKEAETAGREYQEKLGEESQRAVGILGTQVGAVVDGVNQAVAQMKHAVEAMRTTTGDALSKLNSGADTLYVAATDFKKAGDGVATTLSQSGAVATQLYQASASVASASSGLSGFLADYKVSREVMAEMLKTLQAVVDKARHEASLSGDVLAKIDSAAEKLGMAGQTAESYLGQVSSVIDNAHSEFTEGMTRAVAQANRDFHQELTKSVGLLRDGIQELEAVFETVTLKH